MQSGQERIAELGAGCKVQDRSPRRKKGEAFIGGDCGAADCDRFL